MDTSLYVMGGLVVALAGVAYATSGWSQVLSGLRLSAGMLNSIWLRLLVGMLMAGMIQVLIPPEIIGQWMGAGSGFGGILVGTVAGALTPGGPYVNFPILAALKSSGAGAGPLAAYMTSWGLIPLSRTLIWDLPFLGSAFVVSRLVASVLAPIVIGLLTPPILDLLARAARARAIG